MRSEKKEKHKRRNEDEKWEMWSGECEMRNIKGEMRSKMRK